MSDWKPDTATLRSWGTQDKWQEPYFNWLRDQKALPGLPMRSSIHAMFHPLWLMLREMLDKDDDTIEAFFRGEFPCYEAFLCFDPRHAANLRHRNEIARAYEAVIREMLEYSGPVDADRIMYFSARIDEARPYAGPMA